MADQEVIKHTKNIYKVWLSKEHNFWHKLQEFIIEILIIVFAVSLSIWLHGRSEHAHQQKDVKEFLLGLQTDLKNDIQEMKADRKTFVVSRQAFIYIRGLQAGQPADKDSIFKYDGYIFDQTGLVPNNGRFEGFRSAGKIGAIEQPGLQNDIMDLYQENIPVLILYTNHYSKQKAALNDYFNQNLRRSNGKEKDNFLALFSTDMVYNMGNELLEVQPIISQYDKCIANMEAIIAEIDKEYKD